MGGGGGYLHSPKSTAGHPAPHVTPPPQLHHQARAKHKEERMRAHEAREADRVANMSYEEIMAKVRVGR